MACAPIVGDCTVRDGVVVVVFSLLRTSPWSCGRDTQVRVGDEQYFPGQVIVVSDIPRREEAHVRGLLMAETIDVEVVIVRAPVSRIIVACQSAAAASRPLRPVTC